MNRPNYDLVVPRVCMGGAVIDSSGMFEEFDIVVLCAVEWQPTVDIPPNDRSKRVLRIPLDDIDSPLALAPDTRRSINSVVGILEEAYREEKRILITCMAGRNRSGLITALLLRKALQMNSQAAIAKVKEARGPHALSNPTFVRYLMSLA